MKSLLNALFLGLMFSGISILSTYWAKGTLAGSGTWPWGLQFIVLWLAFTVMIFCIDKLFSKPIK